MSAILRRLRWVMTGLNKATPKRLNNMDVKSSPFSPLSQQPQLRVPDLSSPKHKIRRAKKPMLEAVHEVAIYIHRFHNLDLFQQGWYQIKITMRWEDGEDSPLATPSRVVQYEAPDLGSDDIYGVWRINDEDHSFSTQPFRIRYAKQDVFLSMMVAFNLPLTNYKGISTSAVIMKFELMYAPVLENGPNVQASLDAFPAAVHEFRLPPKALLGLHSYCPVHFDAFHSVLVDLSVHITLLKGSLYPSSVKVPSDSHIDKDAADENSDLSEQSTLVKALLAARGVLIEELHTLSKATSQPIDLPDFISTLDDRELVVTPTSKDHEEASAGVSEKVSSGNHNRLEKPNGNFNLRSDGFLQSLPKDELLGLFHSLGNQTFYLWSMFLKFHRTNRTKILEFLREQWATDRKAEWSIWMVYLKVEMPHQYISSAVDDSSVHSLHGRSPILRKLAEEPSQTAATRAELHRRSIAQMKGHHLDLRLVRNQWLLIDPKVEYLMSEVNEEKTSGDFREMGERLAKEVVSFVKKKMDKASRSGNLRSIKLSFVGHSIGNIILRTALTEPIMEPYLRYLHTYVSVSGPHLGYLYSSNSLFNSGLWLLKKLKGTQCIHQLTFTDDPDIQNTFLYKLCKQRTLEHFRNIILLSSPQDGYVPYHSARIEMCQASSGDTSKKAKVFLEMLNECLDQIRAPSSELRVFMRCDVNFDVSLQGRNLNTFIGRAAHIEFLESDLFARFIMWSFPELFR